MNLKFFKLRVADRDYILVDGSKPGAGGEMDYSALAVAILDRKKAVGGRGLCVLEGAGGRERRIREWDRTGNERDAPADSLLCAARYLLDSGMSDGRRVDLVTARGNAKVDVVDAVTLSLDLGPPSVFGSGETLAEGDERLTRLVADPGDGPMFVRRFSLSGNVLCSAGEGRDDGLLRRLSRVAAMQGGGPVLVARARAVTREELWVSSPSRTGDAVVAVGAAVVAARLEGLCEPSVAARLGSDFLIALWEGLGTGVSVCAEPEYAFEGDYFFANG